ncbi:UvrD-helicase domain-containing protein [Pseudonocardia sp. ICBG1293]|uniref:UvrD-helicase domain-containing protein n=1 Tax=Pseudonocardia sp. ICBG1293 TaxID=2844382 RepID=UPI001CCE7FF9|nr:UvrD-helicase domain-containing protein [Pseudonocardia sp. ICBG1293]
MPEVLPGEDRTVGDGLFVDLVPSSCWFTNVRSCVDPADWERLRRPVLRRTGYRCEACGRGEDRRTDIARYLDVHERWTYDEAAGVQTLRRLVCLCSDCHLVTHFGYATVQGHDAEALAHLCTVNSWTREQALAHIADAGRVWEQRSTRTWELDLGILTGAGITVRQPPAPQQRAQIADKTLGYEATASTTPSSPSVPRQRAAAPRPARATGKKRLTGEQQAAVEAFTAGYDLTIQAGAGAGKTSTLRALAATTAGRGLYLAFNKSIATEAGRSFPPSVQAVTSHSLAYAAVGHRYQARLAAPRIPSIELAPRLGIDTPLMFGERRVTPAGQCAAAQKTVLNFCHSADDTIGHRHVPHLPGMPDRRSHRVFAGIIVDYARRIWNDLQTPDAPGNSGGFPFGHDHYFKMWALTEPSLDCDFLLLDEAQDTNPALEKIFCDQRDHAQLVMVGDSAQAIYGWRGARDVMTDFDGVGLTLSRSFRFGDAIADEANHWLPYTGQTLRLTGNPDLTSTVGPLDEAGGDVPDAVLCRTNGGAMGEIMALLAAGHRVALCGGGGPLRSLALAARDLQAGRPTQHHELQLFTSWDRVRDYVDHDPAGQDLKPLVDIIDRRGVPAVLATLDELSSENDAEVVVSTAHKAKGREWPIVRIADNFPTPPPQPDPDTAGGTIVEIDPDYACLAYVAVTRAQHHLDPGSLDWIHHPPGRVRTRTTPDNTPTDRGVSGSVHRHRAEGRDHRDHGAGQDLQRDRDPQRIGEILASHRACTATRHPSDPDLPAAARRWARVMTGLASRW